MKNIIKIINEAVVQPEEQEHLQEHLAINEAVVDPDIQKITEAVVDPDIQKITDMQTEIENMIYWPGSNNTVDDKVDDNTRKQMLQELNLLKALQHELNNLRIHKELSTCHTVDTLQSKLRDLEDELLNKELNHNAFLTQINKKDLEKKITEKRQEKNKVDAELKVQEKALKEQQDQLAILNTNNEDKSKQVEIAREKSYIQKSQDNITKLKKQIESLDDEIKKCDLQISEIATDEEKYQETTKKMKDQQEAIKKLIVRHATDNKYLLNVEGIDTKKWIDPKKISKEFWNIYADIDEKDVYGPDAKEALKAVALEGKLGIFMQSFYSTKNLQGSKASDAASDKASDKASDAASDENREVRINDAPLDRDFIDDPSQYRIKHRQNSLQNLDNQHKYLVKAMLNCVYGKTLEDFAKQLTFNPDGSISDSPENKKIINEILNTEDSFKVDERYKNQHWISNGGVGWTRNPNSSSSSINSDNNPAKSSMDYYNIALGGVGALGLIGLCCALYKDPNAQKQLSTMGETLGGTLGETLWNNLCKLILTGSILGYGCAPTATQTQISDTFNKLFPARKNEEVENNSWSSDLNNLSADIKGVVNNMRK